MCCAGQMLQGLRRDEGPAPPVPPPLNAIQGRIIVVNRTNSELVVFFSRASLHSTSTPPLPAWHTVKPHEERIIRFPGVDGVWATAVWRADLLEIAGGACDVYVPIGARLVVAPSH